MYNAVDTNDNGCNAWCRLRGSQLSADRLSYIKPDEVLTAEETDNLQDHIFMCCGWN